MRGMPYFPAFLRAGARPFCATLLAICLGVFGAAQTKVDLSTQSKGIDFQTQPYTKPLKTGTTLPAICTQAELFFLTSAPPGSNLYACTATNSWSVQAASGTNTVTHAATLPLNAPVIGSGAGGVATGTIQGNTTKFVSYAGPAPTANECAKFDANGNLTTNGLPCGTGGGGGAGALTVESNGTVVGTRGILNFLVGAGISTFLADTGSQINLQQTIDSAVVQTRANQQSGQTLLCSSASGSGNAYTCSMSPTLTAYTTGMMVNWMPDLNGAGGATTLNIDALGARSLKLNDGVNNPGVSDIIAQRMYLLWFDGTNFRKLF